MQCPEESRLMAYFDGESDALTAAEIERHVASCPVCRERLHELASLRESVKQHAPHLHAPAYLRPRILQALDQADSGESRRSLPRRWLGAGRHGFWLGAAAGVLCGIAGCVVFLRFLTAAPSTAVVNELLDAHVGSLMSSHLTDVLSTDQHTVKPWFAGRTEVSPVAVDLEPQGFKLLGGRVDYIDHQPAAVVVYQHGPHVINVFAWSADSSALQARVLRNGYHMAFWRSGDLEYCAVSDTSWEELTKLVELLKGLPQ